MQNLINYQLKTLKHELVNKFNYTNTKKIPKLKKIILNFNCNSTDIKNLSASLLALKLISYQKGVLIYSKKANITLKIRKGNPIGCSVILRKKNMFQFIYKIQTEILPKLKNFEGFDNNKKISSKSFYYNLKDLFAFNGLDRNYYLFSNLTNLNITFIANSKTNKELFFILNSFQLIKK
jgi:large subunit ribosomal protein L5